MSDQNLQEVFNELQNDVVTPEDIIDNKLMFTYDGIMFRVKVPTQKQLAKANSLRNEKFVELIQNPNCLTIKRLIKVLKETQDIDIAKLDEEIQQLEEKMKDTYLSLAKCHDGEEKMIMKHKEELEDIRNKRMSIIIEKAGYLSPAIENQAQDTFYNFLTSECTQVLTEDENEEWKNVWKSFDEYQNDESKLTYIALGRLTELMMNA
jgi:hypothetical protein